MDEGDEGNEGDTGEQNHSDPEPEDFNQRGEG